MTTNLVNDKRYIGMTNGNKGRKYQGSGKLLKKALEKYGKENFKTDIIEVCKTDEQLRQAEMKIISFYNATVNPMFYNLAEGGRGGDTGYGGSTSAQVQATWDKYTDEERAERGKITSEARKRLGTAVGAKNSKAKRARVNGKEYDYLKAALVDYPTVPYSTLKGIAQKGAYNKFHNIKAEYI